jgi:hypothetical protein
MKKGQKKGSAKATPPTGTDPAPESNRPKSKLILPENKLILPQAPALHLPKKSTDKIFGRFAAMLPDIDGITERIIESDLDHTQAIEIESKADDMVDWAPNVLTWCADRRFLGMRPFAKQAEVLLYLFEEYCPRCTDLTYMADIPVLDTVEQVMAKVALLDFGKCPHCGFIKADGRTSNVYKDPTELIAVLGQRSGKTALTSMCISYLVHKNAHLTAPWKAYGQAPGQQIDFTIVATTVGQSEKTLWGTFKGIVENSPWFRQYRQVCNEEGKRHGVAETVKLAETFFWFGHKNMIIYFAANNPSSLRGTTRFGFAIDELGWFDGEQGSTKVRANGPETYAALNNACLTLRGVVDEDIQKNPGTDLPMPMGFCISSPRAMNDAIMTLYREQAGNPRCVRRHWPTWGFHPKNTYAALERLGETRKSTFTRDYGAQPPITDDPLIPRIHVITDAFKTPLSNDNRFGPIVKPSAIGFVDDLEVPSGSTTLSYVTAGLQTDVVLPSLDNLRLLDEVTLGSLGPLRGLFEDLVKKLPTARPHVMGVDLGVTTNALAIVCGYLANNGSKFVTDFVLEVKPTPRRSVNIAHVYENLILKLVENLSVVAVFYDRWSSLHQIQDLAHRYGTLGPLNSTRERKSWLRTVQERKGLPPFLADQYSLNMADAMMLASRLEQGDCLFPAVEVPIMELLTNTTLDRTNYPYAHLALQLATVRARGNRLLKPVGGDDDIFRAWANAAYKAFGDEMVHTMLMQDGRAKLRSKNPAHAGYVSVGRAGKGIQRSDLTQGGTPSSGTAGFPVSVRHGRL